MFKKLKIVLGVFALAAVISYFLIDANEKEFNQTEWLTSPSMRYQMSKDIVESNMLYGKTKEDVIAILGNGERSTLKGKEHIVYSIGTPSAFFEEKEEKLVVIFENDLVFKVIHSEE